jgi:hypothetical protein
LKLSAISYQLSAISTQPFVPDLHPIFVARNGFPWGILRRTIREVRVGGVPNALADG